MIFLAKNNINGNVTVPGFGIPVVCQGLGDSRERLQQYDHFNVLCLFPQVPRWCNAGESIVLGELQRYYDDRRGRLKRMTNSFLARCYQKCSMHICREISMHTYSGRVLYMSCFKDYKALEPPLSSLLIVVPALVAP